MRVADLRVERLRAGDAHPRGAAARDRRAHRARGRRCDRRGGIRRAAGNWPSSARNSPSCSCSPTRTMLRNSIVVGAAAGPAHSRRCAPDRRSANRRAPRHRRRASDSLPAPARGPARSVTKPTDVIATTASTSATNRMRTSPDVKSRRSCRHARTSGFMSTRDRRPLSRRIAWRQRAARCSSCVTSTSVVPASALSANSRSMIAWPVCVSRLPVGSSANSSAGCVTKARASATRCCSPPESCRG